MEPHGGARPLSECDDPVASAVERPGCAQDVSDPGQHSFWKLISLPKVGFIVFTINSLSSCFGFLDPTLSLFVLEKFNLPAGYVGLVFLGLALSYAISSPLFGLLSDKMPHLRKWHLVFGNLITVGCYMFLGFVPILHIKSQLWQLVLGLVVHGISAGMSIVSTFLEILSCAYENGFEEGVSTLGLVFSAMWSLGQDKKRCQPQLQLSFYYSLNSLPIHPKHMQPRRYWTRLTKDNYSPVQEKQFQKTDLHLHHPF
ncbi:MFS-type transporter SLC18B1-like [Nycticebus coucang]|uniref:MFS-type transporter SLC18B1-like n=1 Tax=Nycticebus coucang TaxID=9470 RepID=UPI00234DC55E|nr:MFS-type transporter SLC18B1-like [Nycticebus coucang]